jgi:hypothetical protein
LFAGVVRSLLDVIVAHRIATHEQIGIETLESRLAEELARANAVLLPPTVAGAGDNGRRRNSAYSIRSAAMGSTRGARRAGR